MKNYIFFKTMCYNVLAISSSKEKKEDFYEKIIAALLSAALAVFGFQDRFRACRRKAFRRCERKRNRHG